MKLLVICGPTATGKTKLAVRIAKKFDGELINADSRQVYRYMDIATGKDKQSIDVPIWGIDLVDPDEDFSVGQYVQFAIDKIIDIHNRGKMPILVGGTGFYIQSVLNPPQTISIGPNKKLRESFEHASVEVLQSNIDQNVLARMNNSDKNNPRRLLRKIEIAAAVKHKPVTIPRFDVCLIGLTAPNEILYGYIDDRVDARVEEGVQDELSFLLKKYSWSLPSMQTIGYKEWKDSSTDQAVKQWKFDEHSYARRQKTWFKKMNDIRWFDSTIPGFEENIELQLQVWYT